MRKITLWSVLTLLTVLVGGGATMLADQVRLHEWGRSGVGIPLGLAYEVTLPAGDTLVYYESAERVPTGDVLLALRNSGGHLLMPTWPSDDNSFRLARDGWSGRALWEYQDLPAGDYTVTVNNPHYLSNGEVPATDRVVFGKQPNALADLVDLRQRSRLTGLAITLVLAGTFYGVHIKSVRSS